MTPFEVYCVFRAVQACMTDGDAYNPDTHADRFLWKIAFEKSPVIRTAFKKVSQLADPVAYIIGNFYSRQNFVYTKYEKTNAGAYSKLRESGIYLFRQQIEMLRDSFHIGHKQLANSSPSLYCYLAKSECITLHTATILDVLLHGSDTWKPELPIDKQWENRIRTLYMFTTRPSQIPKYRAVYNNCFDESLTD